MSRRIARTALTELATTHSAPPVASHEVDRTFELPTGLYALTVGFYLAFLVVMAIGLATPGLIIPMAICLIFVVMAFTVPSLWARMNPETQSRSLDWSRFVQHGIQTHTGWTSARDATIQVLILPVVILLWGICAVAIAALV
jgi:hypothetical protein